MTPFNLHFLGVGPQRTGTTWLEKMLRSHPELCFPQDVKETRFFDNYYDKGLDWYSSHFSNPNMGKLNGEIGPSYFGIDDIPIKIHTINPNTKIIINLRDPISRIFSLYRHHVFRGHASGSFKDVVSSTPHLIDSGRYVQHIPRWLDLFNDNVMFIVFDDIISYPEKLLNRVCDFLDVDKIAVFENISEKKGVVSSPRSRYLAKAGIKVANMLRGFRFHKIVEVGKRIKLNDFVFSGGKEKLPDLTREEKSWVLKMHEIDIAYVESLLERDLTKWRRITP